LFILVQLIPLPADFVRFISPSTYSVYAPVISVSGGEWIPLAINQKATLQEFFRISCYSLFYILTIQLLSMDGRLKKTVFTVIGLAAGIALLAIIQQVDSPDKIYWFRTVPQNASPFGPWINPNQFAGFMEMMSPLALGFFLFCRPRVPLDLTLREKVVNFFTMPGSNLYLFLGSAAILMALSVFISLCRGGILTITISAFVFMLLYNMKKPKHGRVAILVITGSVIIAVSWFGWETIISEFNHGFSPSGELSDGRFFLWADSLRIIQSFSLFGTGFGTFIDIFPSFRSFPGYSIFDHAHNDYLELLTDGGIIGFTLAGWFVLAVLRHGWKMIRVRNDQYAVLLGIGALTGIMAMLIHSITDFNMHNGADGLYFFFLCGLLVAVVNTRFGYTESMTLLKKQSKKRNIVYLSGVMMLTVLLPTVQYGALFAKKEYDRVKDIYVNRHLSEGRLQELIYGVTKAKLLDPWEHLYSFKLGTIEWFLQNREKSLDHFLLAARLSPMNGVALQRIGLLMGNKVDDTNTMMLLEKGYQRNLDNDELVISFAEYLMQKGERKKAIEIIATRLQKTPSLIKKWAPLFEDIFVSRAEIAMALPNSVDAWIQYGVFLEKMNDIDEAEFYFHTALSFIGSEEQVKPHWFQALIHFHKKINKPEQALLILRQAAELVPDHASFHIQLGDYYRTEGIIYRAREEYQRALMIDPGNRTVTKRLRQMGLSDSY
jgi:O-antigen ligase